MPWPIAKIPTFLEKALGMQSQQVPNVLDETVEPVIEIGPWGYAQFRFTLTSQTAGAATAYTIAAASEDTQYLLLGASLTRAGGATASATSWLLQSGEDTTQRITLRQLALASTITQEGYFSRVDAYVQVPAGFALIWTCPALGGGETVNLRTLVVAFPAGMKAR